MSNVLEINEVAEEIANIFKNEYEIGQEFLVNFTGAWDPYNYHSVSLVTINVGRGFEKAILVKGYKGHFLYIGPFSIDNYPSETKMFLFYAEEGIYFDNL